MPASNSSSSTAPIRPWTITFSNPPINMFLLTTIVELGAGAQARRGKVGSIGYGDRSDFELNFGRYLPSFGLADGDDKEMQQPLSPHCTVRMPDACRIRNHRTR
jgi:hypothetical protein